MKKFIKHKKIYMLVLMSKMSKNNKKISVGVALCRYNEGTPEIFLVRSRITYNYNAFIFGKYGLGDNELIQKRLNTMTSDEKIIIMTLDFSKMWNHTWLSIPSSTDADLAFYEFYVKCRSKFYKLISRDGGSKLKNMINKSTSIETGWEIPKGRLEKEESEVTGGMRELGEETGAKPYQYSVFHNIKPICHSHEDEGVTYIIKLFVAHLVDSSAKLKLDYNNKHQIAEISDLKWFPMKDIHNLVHQNKHLLEQCRLALKLFKKETKAVHSVSELKES